MYQSTGIVKIHLPVERPAEGWHESASGAVYYVSHSGAATALEVFERKLVTPQTAESLAEASKSKALAALIPPKTA